MPREVSVTHMDRGQSNIQVNVISPLQDYRADYSWLISIFLDVFGHVLNFEL